MPYLLLLTIRFLQSFDFVTIISSILKLLLSRNTLLVAFSRILAVANLRSSCLLNSLNENDDEVKSTHVTLNRVSHCLDWGLIRVSLPYV